MSSSSFPTWISPNSDSWGKIFPSPDLVLDRPDRPFSMTLKLPYIFVDLDETLVHSVAKESSAGRKRPGFDCFASGP